METDAPTAANLKQAVPFLWVTDIERSLRFYVEGLGFALKNKWEPEGKIRWCWLTRGGASIMLQEYLPGRWPEGTLGQGVSLCFQCEDAVALYRELRSRGVEAQEPFVGNSMWVTCFSDPDGYKLDFESMTDVAEETKLSDVESTKSL